MQLVSYKYKISIRCTFNECDYFFWDMSFKWLILDIYSKGIKIIQKSN